MKQAASPFSIFLLKFIHKLYTWFVLKKKKKKLSFLGGQERKKKKRKRGKTTSKTYPSCDFFFEIGCHGVFIGFCNTVKLVHASQPGTTPVFSYRRFFCVERRKFLDLDASWTLWTFFRVQFWCQSLRKLGFSHVTLKNFPGGRSPDPPSVSLDASHNSSRKITACSHRKLGPALDKHIVQVLSKKFFLLQKCKKKKTTRSANENVWWRLTQPKAWQEDADLYSAYWNDIL